MSSVDIKVAMVAFIDMLGYSSKVSSAQSKDSILEIQSQIKFVHDAFDYDPKDELTIESQETLSKRVLAFSDCIVISVLADSELVSIQGWYDVFGSEIASIGLAQAMCVNKGIFIRGGIEIGYWYKDGDVLISSAMVDAYNLERCADYPVIAVGPKLIDEFEKSNLQSRWAEDYNPLKKMFSEVVTGKKKRIKFINYMRQALGVIIPGRSRRQNEEYKCADQSIKESVDVRHSKENAISYFTDHKNAIEKSISGISNKKVLKKYSKLSSIHNRCVRDYGLRDKKLFIS